MNVTYVVVAVDSAGNTVDLYKSHVESLAEGWKTQLEEQIRDRGIEAYARFKVIREFS